MQTLDSNVELLTQQQLSTKKQNRVRHGTCAVWRRWYNNDDRLRSTPANTSTTKPVSHDVWNINPRSCVVPFWESKQSCQATVTKNLRIKNFQKKFSPTFEIPRLQKKISHTIGIRILFDCRLERPPEPSEKCECSKGHPNVKMSAREKIP